jgi:muramoyltetrapeptide carboxypeptidase
LKPSQIPILNPDDTIAFVSSARKISRDELVFAKTQIESWGLKVVFGKNLFQEENQFAGTETQRRQDLQDALDNENIKAILFVRGGYGSVQIVDSIDWTSFQKKPKWIIGFSDITVFHSHIQQIFGLPTLHAAMPITFANNTKSSLENLRKILFGEKISYQIDTHPLNRVGVMNAEIVGGNLSILYSLLGSESQLKTDGKILFLEDLDEYLYHIDRMMQALKRAGMLKNLAGLIIGGMSEMNDNTIPFGKTAEEIIRDVVSEYNYPVAFGFPAGHIDDNNPIVFGKKTKFIIENGSKRNLLYV